MTTATAAPKTFKGFKVTCPFCGDQESTIKLDLNDLKACICTSCDEDFSPRMALAKVAEQMTRWTKVVEWIDLAGELAATL